MAEASTYPASGTVDDDDLFLTSENGTGETINTPGAQIKAKSSEKAQADIAASSPLSSPADNDTLIAARSGTIGKIPISAVIARVMAALNGGAAITSPEATDKFTVFRAGIARTFQYDALVTALSGTVTAGTTWLTGSTVPDNSLGVNGNYYLRTDGDGSIYFKAGGTWSLVLSGGGGGGSSVISADTTIAYPGVFANWAACMASLKSFCYTGKVTINVAAGTYTEPFTIPSNLYMPNLHIVFASGAQVNTTGWSPNLLGVYTVCILGVDCEVGSISGPLTRSAGTNDLFAVAGVSARMGLGTTLGAAGTETHLTLSGFTQGAIFIESEVIGYGSIKMTGMGLDSGNGFLAFGGVLRSVALELDGLAVVAGKNPATGLRCTQGNFSSVTFTATRSTARTIGSLGGNIDFGTVSNTGNDPVLFSVDDNGYAKVTIPASSTWRGQPFSASEGRMDVFLENDITWRPTSSSHTFTNGVQGTINIITTLGDITVDNTDATPDFVFSHRYGGLSGSGGISVGGNFGMRHRYGANKALSNSLHYDEGAENTFVSDADDGETAIVDSSAKDVTHDAPGDALIAALTVDLTNLVPDQEILVRSIFGVTAVTFTPTVTDAPAGLVAGQFYRLRKVSATWYALP